MGKLDGKVVFISGQARAHALRLAGEGRISPGSTCSRTIPLPAIRWPLKTTSMRR
jgi:hypothetical protein